MEGWKCSTPCRKRGGIVREGAMSMGKCPDAREANALLNRVSLFSVAVILTYTEIPGSETLVCARSFPLLSSSVRCQGTDLDMFQLFQRTEAHAPKAHNICHKFCEVKMIFRVTVRVSLAIPLWVGAMSTCLGWEGNRRSRVALAMRHRHCCGLSTYGLSGL